MPEYFIKRRGQVLGPFEATVLKEFSESRKLFPTDTIGESRSGPFLSIPDALARVEKSIQLEEEQAREREDAQVASPPVLPTRSGVDGEGSNDFIAIEDFEVAKPTSITVIVVINFLFSLLSVFNFIFRLGSFSVESTLFVEKMKELPAWRLLTVLQLGFDLVSLFLLVGGGIGLLYCKNWGRSLSLIWSVIAIVLTIFSQLAFVFFIGLPLAEEIQLLPDVERAAAFGGLAGGLCGGCCGGLIYPILLLVFLNRKNLKDFLT